MKFVILAIIGLCAAVLLGLWAGGVFKSDDNALAEWEYIIQQGGTIEGETVTPADDALLAKYDDSELEFKRRISNGKVIYYHQRMIGDAVVELDYILYQIDSSTEKLLAEKKCWRNLADDTTVVVTKEQAESLCQGEVQFSTLFIISPDSVVHPIKPTPVNPCWVVRSIDTEGNSVVTIVDAVTGVVLGGGVPPP